MLVGRKPAIVRRRAGDEKRALRRVATKAQLPAGQRGQAHVQDNHESSFVAARPHPHHTPVAHQAAHQGWIQPALRMTPPPPPTLNPFCTLVFARHGVTVGEMRRGRTHVSLRVVHIGGRFWWVNASKVLPGNDGNGGSGLADTRCVLLAALAL